MIPFIDGAISKQSHLLQRTDELQSSDDLDQNPHEAASTMPQAHSKTLTATKLQATTPKQNPKSLQIWSDSCFLWQLDLIFLVNFIYSDQLCCYVCFILSANLPVYIDLLRS